MGALDEAEETASVNYDETVVQLQNLIDTTTEENLTLGGQLDTLTTQIDEEQGRVDAATETHGTASGRHATEVSAYALFLEEHAADNERIEFELSVLDRAESILAMEGITRSEF